MAMIVLSGAKDCCASDLHFCQKTSSAIVPQRSKNQRRQVAYAALTNISGLMRHLHVVAFYREGRFGRAAET
ncbi:hypothetical protein [Sulfitobacter aestuariivivens]|uniref:hypothetical protein n=1 Tax=Sulfitobacter aestuariivivens TaxID=2766981 RepID=UPI0036219B3C